MNSFSVAYSLHVLAAVLWVGGMFFALFVARPASALLEPPQRLRLWEALLTRFLRWAWVAVIVLPVTGMGVLHLRFAGFATAPTYVHIMTGLYIAMLALFLRLQLLRLPALRRAIADEDWSTGALLLGKVRHLVAVNLGMGVLITLIAAAKPILQ